MKILRLILASLLWPFTLLLGGLLWVVGLVVVRLIARRRYVEEVLSWNKEYLVKGWTPAWAYLFGNLEDGVDGPHDPTHPSVRDWVRKTRYWPFPRKCVSWYIRNPVANERFSKLGVYLNATKIEWVGNSANPWETWKLMRDRTYWCWARQGWRSGLWIVTKNGTTYRIGAKVYAGYTREIDRWQGMVTIQRRRAHL